MNNLRDLKGVGPVMAGRLFKAGINTLEDLLHNFPRSYIDYTHVQRIADIQPGMVSFRCRFHKISSNYVKRKLHITRAQAYDDSGDVNLVWFNQPYRAAQISHDVEYVVSGEYKIVGRYLSISSPSVTAASELANSGMQPVYSQRAGIKPSQFRMLAANALKQIDKMGQMVPPKLLSDFDLMPYHRAISELHNPSDGHSLDAARRTIGLVELMGMTIAAEQNRRVISRLKAPRVELSTDRLKSSVANLPFTLTDDQRRSTWMTLKTITAGDSPSNILINGDVGSGKTAVAYLVAAEVAGNNHQVAIVAPTEVLATQHKATVQSMAQGSGLKVDMLTSSVKGEARQKALKELAKGETDIIVGTHSLFEPEVAFASLGLVVVDEQHRFGVKQRNALKNKTELTPHMVSMTATPIPRSLLLTLYGELDVTVIKEKPPGRQPITTRSIHPAQRDQAYNELADAVADGQQAAIVAPKIETNPDSGSDSLSIEQVEKLVRTHMRTKELSYAILHGRLKSDEKESIITRFSSGEIDLLISTTVIEVGVDVPRLNFMIIESAERFGLAQLHQLRGRVGRRDQPGQVRAIATREEYLGARLKLFASTSDGFELARADLEIRGPGEIYGTAQSGGLGLVQANLLDIESAGLAAELSRSFLDDYNLSDYPRLQDNVKQFQKITFLN